MEIVNIIIIGLLVGLLALFYANSYNKLVRLKNSSTASWNTIVKEINIRFNLLTQLLTAASSVLDEETKKSLNSIIKSYSTKVTPDDIINTYYDANNLINSILPKLNSAEWTKAFSDSFTRIEALREEYNNYTLKINGLINAFPTSLIAKAKGFAPWPFFRGV